MGKCTELVFIIDESGSMSGLESDTIGGFNSMLKKQKEEEGECFVTTIMFSNTYKTVHDRINIKEVEPLTDNDYRPGGGTALLDAFGDAISKITTIYKYIRPEDVPSKTIFVVITDGMENASRKYKKKEIKEMVEDRRENHNWEFMFLGANIDAIDVAHSYGIDERLSCMYENDIYGIDLNYKCVNKAIHRMRNGQAPADWKKDIENRKDKK